MKNKLFSVLISVYKNDNPDDFRTAIESVTIKQTVQPDEVFVYVDGPVPNALASTIKQLEMEIPAVYVYIGRLRIKVSAGLCNMVWNM